MTDEERRKRLEEMSSDATKHLHARKERLEQKALQDKKEMEKDEKERQEKQSFADEKNHVYHFKGQESVYEQKTFLSTEKHSTGNFYEEINNI